MSTRNSYLLLVRSPKKGRPPFGARYDEMEVIQSDTGNKTYSGRILRTLSFDWILKDEGKAVCNVGLRRCYGCDDQLPSSLIPNAVTREHILV